MAQSVSRERSTARWKNAIICTNSALTTLTALVITQRHEIKSFHENPSQMDAKSHSRTWTFLRHVMRRYIHQNVHELAQLLPKTRTEFMKVPSNYFSNINQNPRAYGRNQWTLSAAWLNNAGFVHEWAPTGLEVAWQDYLSKEHVYLE